MSKSFKENNIEKIRIDSYTDGYSIVRVEFDNSAADIKFSIDF